MQVRLFASLYYSAFVAWMCTCMYDSCSLVCLHCTVSVTAWLPGVYVTHQNKWRMHFGLYVAPEYCPCAGCIPVLRNVCVCISCCSVGVFVCTYVWLYVCSPCVFARCAAYQQRESFLLGWLIMARGCTLVHVGVDPLPTWQISKVER